MGWLNDLTNWLSEQLKELWEAIEEFFGDLLVDGVDALLQLVVVIIDAIPVPDFISSVTICALLGSAGPEVAWAFQTFRIGEGLTLIGAGYAFRLLRKFLTLFQW